MEFDVSDESGAYHGPAEAEMPHANAQHDLYTIEEVFLRPQEGFGTPPAEEVVVAAPRSVEHISVADRPIQAILVHEDGSPEEIGLPHNITEQLITRWTTTADEVLAQFKQDRNGLNLERVGACMQGLGVAATDRIAIVPDAYRYSLDTALIPVEGQIERSPHSQGFYATKADTVVVYRNRLWENINGSELTEALLVHEVMHSGGRVDIRLVTDGRGTTYVTTSRTGYATTPYNGLDCTNELGCFIEEGLAQYGYGRYMTDTLNEPRGLAGLRGQHHSDLSLAGLVAVPLEHTFRMPHGGIAFAQAAFGARALGHLIDRDPTLLPALIAGARDDDEAFTEVRGRMNAIAPGMFEHLETNYNNDSSFVDGLIYVCDRLDIPPDRLS